MGKSRVQRTDSELVEASRAVDYEVTMLGAMLDFLLGSQVTLASPAPEQSLANAVLHSLLLATRNLCCFLYSHSPRDNDIIAEDFFDADEDWYAVRPMVAEEFSNGNLVNLISKRLAHLTWERASGTKPSWGAFRISWELVNALDAFAMRVPSSRIDPSLAVDVRISKGALQAVINQYGSVDQVESAPLTRLWDEQALGEDETGARDPDDEVDDDELVL